MSGERYDFVVDTNHRPIKDYWIRFRQLHPCTQKLEGFAILRYHKKIADGKHHNAEFNKRVPPKFNEEYRNGTVSCVNVDSAPRFTDQNIFQFLNSPLNEKGHVPITSLQDFRLDPLLTMRPADEIRYLFFDTPMVPNSDAYSYENLRKFLCKSLCRTSMKFSAH